MRSALLVRTQLINEGTSAGAHLSLEHMLRGELGEHESFCTSKASNISTCFTHRRLMLPVSVTSALVLYY